MRILGLCTIEDVMEEIIGEEVRPTQYSEIAVRSRESDGGDHRRGGATRTVFGDHGEIARDRDLG